MTAQLQERPADMNGGAAVLDGPPQAGHAPATGPAALRAMSVTIGPSLLLDLILGGSVLVTAVNALRPLGGGRVVRLVRPLAAAGTLAAVALPLVLRPWHRRWGATDAEATAVLPGDEALPNPLYQSTHAVTVDGPPERVWRWLVQIGTGRGGWYSYDWLENLAGLHIHSADLILPELQGLTVGDEVLVAPGFGFTVAELEPPRSLVLRLINPAARKANHVEPAPPGPFAACWSFTLARLGERRTRLIARFRIDGRPRLGPSVVMSHLIEIPHFVMERAMLRGIKQRAERLERPRPPGRGTGAVAVSSLSSGGWLGAEARRLRQ